MEAVFYFPLCPSKVSGVTAGTALPHSSLLIAFTTFAEGCLRLSAFCLLSPITPGSTRSLGQRPRAETISHDALPTWGSAPALVPPDNRQKEQPTSSCSSQSALLDTLPNIGAAPRNTIHLHKALRSRAGWLGNQPSGALQKFILLKVFFLDLSSSWQHFMQENRLHWLFYRCLLHPFHFWKPKGTDPAPRGAHNASGHGHPLSPELLFPGVPSPKGSFPCTDG